MAILLRFNIEEGVRYERFISVITRYRLWCWQTQEGCINGLKRWVWLGLGRSIFYIVGMNECMDCKLPFGTLFFSLSLLSRSLVILTNVYHLHGWNVGIWMVKFSCNQSIQVRTSAGVFCWLFCHYMADNNQITNPWFT